MGDIRNAYKTLACKPERKIPVGRPRLRWRNNIKWDVRRLGYGGWD
jgi:hypothetical protein